MAKKSKANVQYTAEGTGKPEVGQLMMWNGTEWIPVNSSANPITGVFAQNHITIANQCAIRVVSGSLCFYQIVAGNEILRARILLADGDTEGFSTP